MARAVVRRDARLEVLELSAGGDVGRSCFRLGAFLVKLGEERDDLAFAPRPNDEVYARHLSNLVAL